jgi:hypothetical protein
MRIKRLPAGFVVPAQPVKAPTRPVGTDWVHEIKLDGYRLIVRRDGPIVRLYSRNAYDRTADWRRSRAARRYCDRWRLPGLGTGVGLDADDAASGST